MSEQVSLLNMFSHYEPPETLKSVLDQAAVVAADIDPERGRVEVCLRPANAYLLSFILPHPHPFYYK